MHYGIIAIGSRGDVQPFIALSLGLTARGHQVTLMAHENFQSFVEEFGIDFHSLAGDTREMMNDPKGLRLLQSGNTLKLLRYIHERGQAVQDGVNRDLWKGCQPADKPVYMGFGSMPILDPALFAQVLKELLARTGHCYLFCTGWSALTDWPTSPNLFVVSSASHQWLFPKCKAAIILGGVGTLAAALKAGIPSVIVSIFGDQHWWGKLIQKKGPGSSPSL